MSLPLPVRADREVRPATASKPAELDVLLNAGDRAERLDQYSPVRVGLVESDVSADDGREDVCPVAGGLVELGENGRGVVDVAVSSADRGQVHVEHRVGIEGRSAGHAGEATPRP